MELLIQIHILAILLVFDVAVLFLGWDVLKDTLRFIRGDDA